MALLTVLALAGPAAAQDTSWASGVRGDGWPDGRVTGDGDMIIFRRPAPKGPRARRAIRDCSSATNIATARRSAGGPISACSP